MADRQLTVITDEYSAAGSVVNSPIPVPRQSPWRRWATLLLLLIAILWLANYGVAFVVRHTGLQKRLTDRLAAGVPDARRQLLVSVSAETTVVIASKGISSSSATIWRYAV